MPIDMLAKSYEVLVTAQMENINLRREIDNSREYIARLEAVVQEIRETQGQAEVKQETILPLQEGEEANGSQAESQVARKRKE